MSEDLLAALERQALLLSLGVVLLLALRPWLLKLLGARATYAAWALPPALLLTPWLPHPGQAPWPALITFGELARSAAVPMLAPVQPGSMMQALLLAAWCAGAVVIAAMQALRQWQQASYGAVLPAGSSPALIGLWKPRIALPVDFEARFSPAERRLILAHEQVHHDRGDNIWNLVACVLTALHWWNPLAWVAARRMRVDQELACDAVVLAAAPGSHPTYARALLAAHGLTPPRAPLASRWGTTHPLVERIAMLNRPQPLPRRRAAALALMMAGLIGVAYAAQGGATGQAAAEVARKVEIRLDIKSAGVTSTPRLITALGVRSRIEWGDAPDAVWRLDITVDRAEDGLLKVLTVPSYAGKALGSHTGVLASGQSFGHRIGGTDGVPELQMTRVVTLLPADFKMPANSSKPRS